MEHAYHPVAKDQLVLSGLATCVPPTIVGVPYVVARNADHAYFNPDASVFICLEVEDSGKICHIDVWTQCQPKQHLACLNLHLTWIKTVLRLYGLKLEDLKSEDEKNQDFKHDENGTTSSYTF